MFRIFNLILGGGSGDLLFLVAFCYYSKSIQRKDRIKIFITTGIDSPLIHYRSINNVNLFKEVFYIFAY